MGKSENGVSVWSDGIPFLYGSALQVNLFLCEHCDRLASTLLGDIQTIDKENFLESRTTNLPEHVKLDMEEEIQVDCFQ